MLDDDHPAPGHPAGEAHPARAGRQHRVRRPGREIDPAVTRGVRTGRGLERADDLDRTVDGRAPLGPIRGNRPGRGQGQGDGQMEEHGHIVPTGARAAGGSTARLWIIGSRSGLWISRRNGAGAGR